MTDKVVIAIDIGSSSVRCSAYQNFTIIMSSSRNLSSVEAISGKIRLQAGNSASSLLSLVEECVDETLAMLHRMSDDFEVVALGFTSFVMNLIGIDADGNLLGPKATMSYACSSDAVAKEVDSLKRKLGDKKVLDLYRRTGAPLHSAYAIAQLREFYRSNPVDASKVSAWKTISSLLLDRWTTRNDTPISYSEASWCGLLNYATCEYDDLALELLPECCRKALPKLADFDEVSVLNAGISERTPYWNRWPVLRGARLFLGVGDGACANIGSKCTLPSRIACTIGTSAAARVCLYWPIGSSQTVELKIGLFCYRIDRSHVLIGGALTDGGSAVEWIKQLLNLTSSNSFEECLRQVASLMENDLNQDSGVTTPTLVPFLSGERSTGFRTRATGAMIDLTRDTTPAHILKSVMEGVTLRLNAVVSLICQTCESIPQNEHAILVVSGKALEANQLWRQMLANCSGMSVVFDRETQEGTSRGVVILITRGLQQNANNNANRPLPVEIISSVIVENPEDGVQRYWEQQANRQEQLISAVSHLYS